LAGKFLEPGEYTATTVMALTGILTFDAKDDPDAVWTIYIEGALSAAAASQIVMIGGGDPANINWVVTGAISLAAGVNAIGNMEATGAISVGAGAITGDLEATGAITVGASARVGALKSSGAISIGSLGVYVSADPTPTLGAGAHAVWEITSSPTPQPTEVPTLAPTNAPVEAPTSAPTASPVDSPTKSPVAVVSRLTTATMGGLALEPGTYIGTAAMSLAGTMTLDAGGNPDAVFTFNIGGAFSVAAAAEMVMAGDAKPENVHWVVTGAVTLGAGSKSMGSMKSSGAIGVGAGCTTGDLEATGAISVGASAIVGHLKATGAISLGAKAGYKSATTPAALAVGAGAYVY
jgi:hypothetical protein